MLRSFALAVVFTTFDISRSAIASLGLPRTVVYPLGLLLSTATSLVVAELWIHRSRGAALLGMAGRFDQPRTRSTRTVFHQLGPSSSIGNHARPG